MEITEAVSSQARHVSKTRIQEVEPSRVYRGGSNPIPAIEPRKLLGGRGV